MKPLRIVPDIPSMKFEEFIIYYNKYLGLPLIFTVISHPNKALSIQS